MKPKTLNAFALSRIEYTGSEDEEITIEIDLRRRAPKGARHTSGEGFIRLRMTLDYWQAVRITRATRQGMTELAAAADRKAARIRGNIDALGRAA